MSRRNFDNPSAETFEVRVNAGPNRGASAVVDCDSRLSVGNGFDNNLVLDTGHSQQWSADIVCRADGVRVSVLKGDLQVGLDNLATGQTREVSPGTLLRKGETEFVFQRQRVSAASDKPARATMEQTADTVATAQPGGRGRLLALACLAAGFCVVGAGLVAGNGSLGDSAGGEAMGLSIRDNLKLTGFDHLHYTPATDGNAAIVTGYVDSRADKYRLMAIAQDNDAEVVVNVQENDSFANSIEDIFRVNGVTASVDVIDVGSAVVTTRTADTAALQRIESILKSDMRQLESLKIRNTVPPIERDPVLIDDPDKEIALVVGGESGYIVTRDMSRYFVGSLMPNGYEVVSISDGNVVISRDDNQLTLEF